MYSTGITKLNRNKNAAEIETAQIPRSIRNTIHLGVYDLGKRIIFLWIIMAQK